MKLTGKSYSSVIEMVRDMSDPLFAAMYQAGRDARRISSTLASLRAAAGMSEAELAAKLGWSKAKVERLEYAEDSKIRIEDVFRYAHGIGFTLTLEFKHDVEEKRPGLGIRTIV